MATFQKTDILTPQPTRQDFANAFGNNQRLIRFFESLVADVRQTIPDAIVSGDSVAHLPFLLWQVDGTGTADNAYTLVAGNGLNRTDSSSLKTVTIALNTPVAIGNGGTGASTAAGARLALGAAASGANGDITSLSGLTTPLSIAQGGTGANNAGTALSNLGGASTAGNLSQFAATTSAQLASVITDETGSGSLVFATAPNIAQPNIIGVTTNSSAAPGSVGELLTNTTTGTAATSTVPLNATSVSLTAGDWDVEISVRFVPAAATTPTLLNMSISQTSATQAGFPNNLSLSATFPTATTQVLPGPRVRVSLASTTTIFCVARIDFPSGSATVDGFIEARRVR